MDDQALTYAEALTRSAELARALLAAGASLGTRVGLVYPNGPAFVVAWLAAARIGAVSVPLSTFSTSAELSGLLRRSDVAMLLGAHRYRSQDFRASLVAGLRGLDLAAPPPLFSEAAPSLRRIALELEEADPDIHPGWTHAGLLGGAAGVGDDVLVAAEAAVTPADHMVIVHTSGSTSEPKGVIHSHGALIRHLDNLNQLRRYVPAEILFSNSPFFWIGGFAYALLGTLVAGATLVCSNAPGAAGVLDLLERERPTMVNGFAASVAHLPQDPTFSRRDLSSIRRGNLYPIMPDDVRPADPDLRHAMLGMTEAGSVCLADEDESEQPEHRRGSFGRPVPGLEARIAPRGRDGGRRGRGRRALPARAVPHGRLRRAGALRDLRPRRLVPHRRPRDPRRRRVPLLPRPGNRHGQDRRGERLPTRGRSGHPRSERPRLPCRGDRRRGAGAGGRRVGAGADRRLRCRRRGRRRRPQGTPARPPVGLQGAADDRRRPRRGGPDDVERKARPARR